MDGESAPRGTSAPHEATGSPRGGLEEQMGERRAKRGALGDAGVDPYPSRFDRSATAAELHARHSGLARDTGSGETARVAGRVMSIRRHGRLVFATLRDESGRLQLLVQADRLSPEAAAALASLDTGDWLGAEGEVVSSRRGELSVDVRALWPLAKALRPLPDKWHGLSDPDTRYRQREADLIANESTRRLFDTRAATVASLRRSLLSRGFVEAETPVLQAQAGGALAEPFRTRAKALGTDLTLRVAPELYLKRLVVGGYENVFEVARVFRNEGIDARHNPEFTVLEAYSAFADFRDGMELTEQLVVTAAEEAAGRLLFEAGGERVDLHPPWERRQLLDMVEEAAGRRMHPSMPVGEARAVCDDHGVAYLGGWGAGRLIFELYDKVVQPGVTGPLMLCGYPVEVSPLARGSRDDPALAERFELVVLGRELVNGYSELNDPDEQAGRFRAAAAAGASGDPEAHPADAAFVRALEYGLPPTSGIGIGVDRLVMLLGEVQTIRDVLLFPMLRPEAGA